MSAKIQSENGAIANFYIRHPSTTVVAVTLFLLVSLGLLDYSISNLLSHIPNVSKDLIISSSLEGGFGLAIGALTFFAIKEISSLKPRRIAAHSSSGKKPEQQDGYLCIENNDYIFTAVIDGHGLNGARMTQFIKQRTENLFNTINIQDPQQKLKLMTICLKNSVYEFVYNACLNNLSFNFKALLEQELDKGFSYSDAFSNIKNNISMNDLALLSQMGGATISLTLLDKRSNTVTAASLGDSTARIYPANPNHAPIALTPPHTWQDLQERERARNSGKVVLGNEGEPGSVLPNVGMAVSFSRSLGDVHCDQFLSREPAISQPIQMRPGDLLVNATAPVWAVNFGGQLNRLSDARHIVSIAEGQSDDNLTVVTVRIPPQRQ